MEATATHLEKDWIGAHVQPWNVVSSQVSRSLRRPHIADIVDLSSTCVVTLLRIIRIQNTNLADTDPTISGATIAQWSILEPTIAIVNSCFPTIRPVLHKYFPSLALTKRFTSKTSSGSRSTHSPLSTKTSPSSTVGAKKQFQRLEDDLYPLQEVHVSSNKALPSTPDYYSIGVDGPVVPPRGTPGASGITYTREWKVQSSAEEGWV